MDDESYIQVYRVLHALEAGGVRPTRKTVLICATAIVAVLAFAVAGPRVYFGLRTATQKREHPPQLIQRVNPELRTTIDAAAFVPAEPLHRPIPDASLFRPAAKYRGSRIEVEVKIDEEGRVTNARVINPPKDPKIEHAILQTAQQWTFKPSTVQGKPISSTHKIVFEFQK
ncbi:MAG: energy transducer TonB [Acidobacteriaceae bacterium]|nr:energy transducer TonB [Acidobacteriaceae bacterium]MBV9781833.1 energy transducer TonB [Acidobacteriaceae bacterium]